MDKRIIIILLIAIIMTSIYSELVYKPFNQKNKKSGLEARNLESRIEEFSLKLPEIKEEESRFTSLKDEVSVLEKEIEDLEERLPGSSNNSLFLSELTKEARGLNLEITSIRQKIEKEPELLRLLAELKLKASYQETVNYLCRIEALSPYLAIEEMEILEPKKGSLDRTDLRLLLSIPMSERASKKLALIAMPGEKVEVSRDIFALQEGPQIKEGRLDLKLEGITFRDKNSTAIINGEVVKTGDKVKGLIIKNIFPDSVIFSDGMTEWTLMLANE